MKQIFTMLVPALVLAGAAPAPAQEVQQRNAERTGDLAEIVVTAQKRSEPLEKVPITVAVVTGEELTARGVLNTTTLREVVPGLNMTEVGIYLMPTIRGVTTSVTGPGADSNVAIYLDGFYQPSQAGNVFDLPDVDRIEVLKGPQGTLFGRNATGGAIQIFTRGPSFTPTGSVTASEGVYAVGGADTQLSGFLSGPLIANKVAASLSVNYERNAGYMHNLLYSDRLGYTNLTIRGKLLFQLNENAKFTLGASYAHRNDRSALVLNAINGNIAARAVDPTIREPANGYDSIQYREPHLKSDAYSETLRGEFDIGVGTITSLTGFEYVNIYKNVADSDASPLNLPFTSFYNPSFSKSYSQEIDFASQWDIPLSLIAGVNYYREDAEFDPLVVLPSFAEQGKQVTAAKGVFSELTYQVNDRLSVIGGLRYSDEHKHAYASILPAVYTTLGEKTFVSFTPRASVRYEVADHANVYVTYSTGFKSGLFDTIGLNPVPVSPEKIDAYEVGFKMRRTTYSLEAAAFYYNYRNLQVGAFRGPLVVDQNAGAAKMAGLDLNGMVQISRDLHLHAAVSYIPEAKYVNYDHADASVPVTVSPVTGLPCTACGNTDISVNASGDRLIRTARVTGTAGFNYTHDLGAGQFGISSSIYYSSDYSLEVTGRVKQPSYATLSSEISWTSNRWRYSLWGRNLTDRRNITVVTEISAPGDTVNYAPPRQVGVAANYTF